ANDIFFSKAIKAAPRLQHKNKSKLFNSLAIENNEKIKRDIIDFEYLCSIGQLLIICYTQVLLI
ncbi:hypothetical protein, partial [Francisella tularensis]|uniref:hypothetical protein n=1 Tax=Francisella tularensis TaxID=263 RepID=UPI001F2F268B